MFIIKDSLSGVALKPRSLSWGIIWAGNYIEATTEEDKLKWKELVHNQLFTGSTKVYLKRKKAEKILSQLNKIPFYNFELIEITQ